MKINFNKWFWKNWISVRGKRNNPQSLFPSIKTNIMYLFSPCCCWSAPRTAFWNKDLGEIHSKFCENFILKQKTWLHWWHLQTAGKRCWGALKKNNLNNFKKYHLCSFQAISKDNLTPGLLFNLPKIKLEFSVNSLLYEKMKISIKVFNLVSKAHGRHCVWGARTSYELSEIVSIIFSPNTFWIEDAL